MKLRFFFNLLLLMSSSTFANDGLEIVDCYINSQNNQFTVLLDDQDRVFEKSQRIDSYEATQFDCSRKIAGVYDGDDLFSFTIENGFSRNFVVADRVENAILKARRGLLAFYDMDDLFVINSSGETERNFMVDDNVENSLLKIGPTGVSFYDNDDLYIYDSNEEEFKRNFMVDDNAENVTLVDTRNGVLFYEGDDLYSYCDGDFDRNFTVDDNAFSRVIKGTRRRPIGIQIGEEGFILTESCELNEL